MKQIKQQNTVICLLSKPVSFAAHQSVHCCIDQAHRQSLFFLTLISSQIAIHHSATHILHSVLSDLSFGSQSPRSSLQAGSRIRSDSFAFDFYTGFINEQMKDLPSFLQMLEQRMNTIACSGIHDYQHLVLAIPITWKEVPYDKMKELSGQFLGDIASISRKSNLIRGVTITGVSKEFCCGQHVTTTADVYPCVITGIQSVAAGIKRIEAKAGKAASDWLLEQHHMLKDVCRIMNSGEQEVATQIMRLKKESSELSVMNSLLMRSSIASHSPSFVVSRDAREGDLQVYEVEPTFPEEYVSKLMNRLKGEMIDTNRLIIHSRSFVLLCKKDLDASEEAKLKEWILAVGEKLRI